MKKINISIIFLSFIFVFIANAQSRPQVILTWQANNFYPSDYEGKALATKNTPISVSVEVIKDNKIIDLSRASFTWYLDEKSVTSGDGLKDYSFNITEPVGGEHFVRVQIRLGQELFEDSIRITVSPFLTVVSIPYPNGSIQQGDKVIIEAIPYFFNISSLGDLSFSWQVNNQKQESVGDNALSLIIGSISSQSQKIIQITTFVQNKKNQLEFSNVKKNLIIK
ncbi:MAG: hypothetical protein AAB617_02240 [Patescibacteria group bacterium]